MLDSIFSSVTNNIDITLPHCLLVLFCGLVIGFVISLFFRLANRQSQVAGFTATLVMLPPVVAVIIMLAGSSVASALSMGGVFALVRFRSAPARARDMIYVILAMASGLAIGMGYLLFAVVFSIALSAILFALVTSGYGAAKAGTMNLKLVVPENLNYQNAFEDLFLTYTASHKILRVKTADLGTVFQIEYEIIMKPEVNQKNFIDDLRARNGNMTIALNMRPESTDLFEA